MARRRSALPVISEPSFDPGHITALQEEESRRRNSTNSIHLVRKISLHEYIQMYLYTDQDMTR